MPYTPKDYKYLLGTAGFSDNALNSHFKLYEGYVKNTNTLVEDLGKMTEAGEAGTPAHSELQRRLGWEWNGMRLHEIYFGAMTKEFKPLASDSPLMAEINRIYGSYDAWEKDFKTIGMMRGMGWIILYYDPESKELFNTWINEHDVGHLAGCTPLLAMDVLEHAYIFDYGTNRADYIDAFIKAIDWNVVSKRFA